LCRKWHNTLNYNTAVSFETHSYDLMIMMMMMMMMRRRRRKRRRRRHPPRCG
jgi:preprotein translocase subunit YajC